MHSWAPLTLFHPLDPVCFCFPFSIRAAFLARSSPISCPASYSAFWLRFFLSHPADSQLGLQTQPALVLLSLIVSFWSFRMPGFPLNYIRGLLPGVLRSYSILVSHHYICIFSLLAWVLLLARHPLHHHIHLPVHSLFQTPLTPTQVLSYHSLCS